MGDFQTPDTTPGPDIDAEPSEDRLGDGASLAPEDQGRLRKRLLGVAAVAAVLGWSYWREFQGLFETWNRDPNYSHGVLVGPIAALIFWRRLSTQGAFQPTPWPWGLALLATALVARASFHERGNQWGEVATLLPALFGLTLALGGKPMLRRAWPAIAYLSFMMPLPGRIDAILANPLQKLATSASCQLLKLSGTWVIAEGNVIHVDADRLEVATACNGLSMMVTLAATVTAIVLIAPLRPWRQVVLLLSIVPVALASNILRITATAWCYHRFGAAAGEKFAHDAAGWLMMPIAMILVGLEVVALSWLVQDEETELTPMILGRPITDMKAPTLGPSPRRAGREPGPEPEPEQEADHRG